MLEGIAAGRLNKQIAGDIGIAEKTIKYHRGNLMRKMKVRTVAELLKVAQRAGIGKTRRLTGILTGTKVQVSRRRSRRYLVGNAP